MKHQLHIQGSCHIKNNTIAINGNPIVALNSELSFSEFSKQVYKDNNINYPKFFKMDNLCKLAFLASEFLLNQSNLDKECIEKMGIVLSNNSASLDTDRKHQSTINDKDNYFPSPAVFVYTLANIAIGEISIRHQIKGENAFFVSETFNETLLEQYTTALALNDKSQDILCGWVDYDGTTYEAFMYLVAKDGKHPHTNKIIKELYTK